MRQLKFYITIGYFLFFAVSGSTAQILTISKEPYKNVQFFTPIDEFYDDGSILSRYSAYTITCVDGNPLLKVPESISRPHTIQIVPGNYIVEVKTNDNEEKFLVKIDESSFQQFRLNTAPKLKDTDPLSIYRPKIDKHMSKCEKQNAQ